MLRPRSLRGQLLRWLVALYVVAIAVTAWSSYVAYGRLVNMFMDEQMRLVAESHASHHRVPTLEQAGSEGVLRSGVFVVQVWSADGASLLASSYPAIDMPLRSRPGFTDARTGNGDEGGWRIYTTAPGADAAAPRVQVLQNNGFRRSRIIRRALLESLPMLLLLPITLLLLWAIVSAASRSLRVAAHDVVTQGEGSAADLPVARVPEEIAPLVAAFNSLLARLRGALADQRRFMQDAAHELRTPMTAIGLQIENLRAHVPAGDAALRFEQLEAGVKRAQHLIEQLLRLARQDAPLSSARTPVDVASVLRDSVGQMMVLADQRRVDVGFDGRIAPMVPAPAADLRSVFDNLIDNAVRYAPEGGVVDVRLHEIGGRAVVDVTDNGPGIPGEQLARVFDRFFRAAAAPVGGSGLGLAIAQSAARRHGLRIELSNRSDGAGLLARVYLPAASF